MLCSAETMRCRERSKKPGDVFPVRDSYHYPLPSGLPAGTPVRLIQYEAGYWIVEASGQRFTVFQTLVNAGFDYEVNGRWLPESDPRVHALLKRDTLANAPSHPAANASSLVPLLH